MSSKVQHVVVAAVLGVALLLGQRHAHLGVVLLHKERHQVRNYGKYAGSEHVVTITPTRTLRSQVDHYRDTDLIMQPREDVALAE